MISYITNRNIRVYNADNQISYNSDYIAEFRFDDEWNGKIKTARFVQNGEHFDVVLVDDRCEIPPLKTGFVRVGVFSDSMTSTYADVYYKTSIKDGSGNPTEPPEDVYAQLTALIESGILKGDDGLTPYVGSNNNWWIGDIDTGVLARGTDGEDGYTPVKGVDYFTEEEIQQIQNEVSGGAIGDFKAVVDEETATFNANAENTLTGYNANAQEKFETYNANANSKFSDYNTNAEEKFSKYTSNAEAKLSEYNKNDLDKTALYNTNADSKFTTYNENAETKFSEYTNNAETKLSEYNQNDSDKTALYNANAENKLSAYDSNAQAKFDLYNQNDSEKTEAYNNNAQTKLAAYNENADNRVTEFNAQTEQIQSQIDNKFETYNTNAEAKFSEYNSNAESKVAAYNQNDSKKLEAYNQNHTEKVAEYNQNAETKTAEFDANAAALQTEVDRLRGECDQLAAENRKQENRIDALIKLNKGQTYDILPEEGETASRTAPSGAKYVSVDKVGGKSVVWNQSVSAMRNSGFEKGLTFTRNADGSLNISGTITEAFSYDYVPFTFTKLNFKRDGRKYLLMLNKPIQHTCGINGYSPIVSANSIGGMWSNNTGTDLVNGLAFLAEVGTTIDIQNLRAMVFDLTQMFGSTIADYIYSLEQSQAGAGVAWFKKQFPDDYYPYSEPTIISSQTDRVDVASADSTVTQQITTGFPVLNSAGSVYDYIDLNDGKLHQRVGKVDLGTFNWDIFAYGEATVFRSYDYIGKKPSGNIHIANITCSVYESVSANSLYSFNKDKAIAVHNRAVGLMVNDSTYTDAATFKSAMSGVMLYYELAEELITDIEIPTELTDWLTVEAGGSITLHNTDESKQLAVPNAVSWVRKLNEVE